MQPGFIPDSVWMARLRRTIIHVNPKYFTGQRPAQANQSIGGAWPALPLRVELEGMFGAEGEHMRT
jgi:hypothetical protein